MTDTKWWQKPVELRIKDNTEAQAMKQLDWLMDIFRNDVWEVMCKISTFRADMTTNMAVIGISFLWLAN
jgi:hypothetical protein